MKHYTKEELDLYRNGEMSVLGRIACTNHLHNCRDCTKLLEELKEDDSLIDNLRSSILLYQQLSQQSPLRNSNNTKNI